MTDQNPPTKFNSTQALIAKMAEALEAHGVTIYCPWDGDLSDEEIERYEGLVAVLDVLERHYKALMDEQGRKLTRRFLDFTKPF
jgi:hypothetical protein